MRKISRSGDSLSNKDNRLITTSYGIRFSIYMDIYSLNLSILLSTKKKKLSIWLDMSYLYKEMTKMKENLNIIL